MRTIPDIFAKLVAAAMLLLLASPAFAGPDAVAAADAPLRGHSELRSDFGTLYNDGILPKEISAAREASPRTGEATSSSPAVVNSAFTYPADSHRTRASRPRSAAGRPLYCLHESYLI